MTPTEQGSEIDWKDGTLPVSRRYDDPYFSMQGGLAETAHVFLAGNDLPARLCHGFHIAELGFGTGLNLLATHLAHAGPDGAGADYAARGTIRYTSFEAHPLSAADIARALAAFPQALAVAGPFLAQWAAGQTTITLPGITAEIILGCASTTLPSWQARADAWFLDGFAPARNPALWTHGLMAEVARHTATGGTFATYTAAGHVRRALADAGFAVTRQPGYGRKRHMTKGALA